MARDIEEFLRRAAERRRQQQAKQQPPAPPPRQQPPRRPLRPAQPEVIEEIEVVQPAVVRPSVIRPRVVQPLRQPDVRSEGVADHVRRHINTSDISDHAEHLGDRIKSVDNAADARIHRKFDHEVGQLGHDTVTDDRLAETTQELPSSVAQDLVEMFRSPKSIRQVILLNEIMKRPDFD